MGPTKRTSALSHGYAPLGTSCPSSSSSSSSTSRVKSGEGRSRSTTAAATSGSPSLTLSISTSRPISSASNRSTHTRSSSIQSQKSYSSGSGPSSSSSSNSPLSVVTTLLHPISSGGGKSGATPSSTSPVTATYSPTSPNPRYFSFDRRALGAVFAITLISATFRPQFPTGGEAAFNGKEDKGILNTASAGFGDGEYVSSASIGGQWDLIGHSGVSAMHAILRPFTDNILFLERVQSSTFARSQGSSQPGKNDPKKKFAWSTEFSVSDGQWRSLDVKSNMFCSAGGYLPDGTVVSIAGGQPSEEVMEGYDGIRLFKPCNETKCDWKQDFKVHLQEKRWYPTVEALASGELFILGGSNHASSVNNDHINVPNFELFPPLPGTPKTIPFPFLIETLPNNLYPMVHLLPDKNLFILASTKAVILSTSTWKIIKRLPDIPGPPRNYPLTGGSVLLPLSPENNFQPEVLVCGGATEFSTQAKGVSSCGRISPLSEDPQWEMEEMPFGRMMPDMAHLADGSVLIINGANTGTAGFDRASDPVLHPVQYLPYAPRGQRFKVWNPSLIARMYHSVAFLLPDMSVLVAGSNPNGKPIEYGDGPFPTEYRVERFLPPYLFQEELVEVMALSTSDGMHDTFRFPIVQGEITGWPVLIHFGETFGISVRWYNRVPTNVRVALVQPGFITHSTHMSQRYVGLEIERREPVNEETGADLTLRVKAPSTGGLAPPAHYMLVVLLDDVPVLEAKWLRLTT